MNLTEAAAKLTVPACVANNTAVSHGQAILRERIDLARATRGESEAAPDYVLRAVTGLEGWVDEALRTRTPR